MRGAGAVESARDPHAKPLPEGPIRPGAASGPLHPGVRSGLINTPAGRAASAIRIRPSTMPGAAGQRQFGGVQILAQRQLQNFRTAVEGLDLTEEQKAKWLPRCA